MVNHFVINLFIGQPFSYKPFHGLFLLSQTFALANYFATNIFLVNYHVTDLFIGHSDMELFKKLTETVPVDSCDSIKL